MGQRHFSPLRYPGGKSSLYDFLSKVIKINNLQDGHYAEAFAGGAGAALELLLKEQVSKIFLNDKDPFIYAFWKAVLCHTNELIKLIRDTPATIEEWVRRNQILLDKDPFTKFSTVEIGFTAFYLNRCNRSGILTAGPIGGKNQNGNYLIDARYNTADLIKRIELIGRYSSKIHLYNCDAIDFIKKIKKSKKVDHNKLLVYLDPPYVVNGKELYSEYFEEADHEKFAKFIQKQQLLKWLISYDDAPLVHQLYRESQKNVLEFNYFANQTKVGKELVISSNTCSLPSAYTHYSKTVEIENNQLQLAI